MRTYDRGRCRLQETPPLAVGVLAGNLDRAPDGMEGKSRQVYYGRINAGVVAADFAAHAGGTPG
jgi:hypothetical protein